MAEKTDNIVTEVTGGDDSISIAELKEAGIENVTELMEKLKKAKATKAEHDTLKQIADAMTQAVTQFTEVQKSMIEEKRAVGQDEAFERLSKEKMVETFLSLPADDPKRKEIYEELSKEYGLRSTSLILQGSDIQKALQRPLSKQNKNYEDLNDFRNAFDNTMLLTAAKGGIQGDMDDVTVNRQVMKSAMTMLKNAGLEGIDTLEKAMDTAETAGGIEWLPRDLSANMAEDIYLALDVAGLFPRWTMTSKLFDIPIRTARGTAYRISEATAASQYFTSLFTESQIGTGKVTMTSRKLGTAMFLSDELEQDSILAVMSMLRDDVIWSLANGIEDAVLNGGQTDVAAGTGVASIEPDGMGSDGNRLWTNSTGNTTGASGSPTLLTTCGSDCRSAWNGLRHSYFVGQSGTGVDLSTLTLAGLRSVRKEMLKYGQRPNELAWIVSPNTHIDLLNLGEVVTIDKFGPNATVIRGEIGKIDGIPVVVSQNMYTFLAATGKFTDAASSTSNAKTSMLCVNRRGFAFGDRRTVRVETGRNPLAGQSFVLSTWRGDFQKMFPSTEPLLGLGVNIAK